MTKKVANREKYSAKRRDELVRWGTELAMGQICVLCDAPLDLGDFIEFNGIRLCSERCKAEYIRYLKRGVMKPRNEEALEAMGFTIKRAPAAPVKHETMEM